MPTRSERSSSPRRRGPPRPPTRRWRRCGRRSRRRTPRATGHAHEESVEGVAWVGDQAVVSIGLDGRLQVSDASDGSSLGEATLAPGRPQYFAATPAGDHGLAMSRSGHRVGVASGRRRPTGADAGPDPPRRDGRRRLADRRRPGRRRWRRLGDRARRRPVQHGLPPPAALRRDGHGSCRGWQGHRRRHDEWSGVRRPRRRGARPAHHHAFTGGVTPAHAGRRKTPRHGVQRRGRRGRTRRREGSWRSPAPSPSTRAWTRPASSW